MTPEQHHAEMETWRSVVGQAIVCFGELELITYKCLAHIPSDQISKTSSRLAFTKRVDLIIEILEGRAAPSGPVATFVKQLRRAKELAQTRNDIAHNPVMLNMFIQEASGDLALENCIATARGGRFIDLAGAKEFADEVENLASEMWLQIAKIIEHYEDPST